jgi:hypothetical protein
MRPSSILLAPAPVFAIFPVLLFITDPGSTKADLDLKAFGSEQLTRV